MREGFQSYCIGFSLRDRDKISGLASHREYKLTISMLKETNIDWGADNDDDKGWGATKDPEYPEDQQSPMMLLVATLKGRLSQRGGRRR